MSSLGDLLILAACFFVVLSLYELGRFIAAKLSGVPVLELSFGYRGHRVVSFMWGETRYSISKIPLLLDAAIVRGRDEDNTPRIEGCFMHEFAHRVLGDDDTERRALMSERERAESLLSRREGHEESTKHLFMLLSGSLFTVMCMWLFHFVALYSYIPFVGPTNELRVGEVLQGGVAQKAGVQAGDVFDSINGTRVATWDEVAERLIGAKSDSQVVLIRARFDGKSEKLTISVPAVSVGGTQVGLAYGFRPSMGRKEISFTEAFTNATPTLLAVPVWIASFVVGPREAEAQSMFSAQPWCSHVVQTEAAQWRFGFVSAVALLWYIAIFMNLLPLPWADGYRLMSHLVRARSATSAELALKS